MTDIEKINIKIDLKEGITGKLSYKYNVNTNLKSTSASIYVPLKYDLKKNARNISELKNASLYSDKIRLEEFLKKTNRTYVNKDDNIKFIIKLLFKKNSKFYIKKWQFIVLETPEDIDINLNSIDPTNEKILKKIETLKTEALKTAALKSEALKEKHAEIRKMIIEPYKDLPKSDYDYYEPTIKKQIIERYQKFLTNTTEKNEYIEKYINNYKNNRNQIGITLILTPTKETAEKLYIKGFNIAPQHLPRFRDCKLQKQQIYNEFLNLLCKPLKEKTSENSLPDLNDIKKQTKKGGNKYKKAVKKFSRKYIGHPSIDLPFCVKHNNKKIHKTRKKLTISSLQEKSSHGGGLNPRARS